MVAAMSIAYAREVISRDYYTLEAPLDILERLGAGVAKDGQIVLELQQVSPSPPGLSRNHSRIESIAFPRSLHALAILLQEAGTGSSPQTAQVLLPRSAFDRIADHFGCQRITTLSLNLGEGAGDIVLQHLAACLAHELEGDGPGSSALTDDLALALILHIAQQYGKMASPPEAPRGGLAAWQLRLARRRLDQSLDGKISLEELASECGLSASHFTRAFSCSTGLAPHRWLMQRRIEIAKDLILRTDLPLAEVALGCGFSDQSHFTRTFATLVGLPPAKWRYAQQQTWTAN